MCVCVCVCVCVCICGRVLPTLWFTGIGQNTNMAMNHHLLTAIYRHLDYILIKILLAPNTPCGDATSAFTTSIGLTKCLYSRV